MGKLKRSLSESNLSSVALTGNRLVRGDSNKSDNDAIVLYRGIQPYTTTAAKEKLQFTTHAEQTSLNKTSVISPHNPLDNTVCLYDHTTVHYKFSPYTSWTTLPSVAKQFATNNNAQGVVMQATIKKSDLLFPHEAPMREAEYIVNGTVIGAKLLKIDELAIDAQDEMRKKSQWKENKSEISEKHEKDKISIKNDPLIHKNKKESLELEYSAKGVLHKMWMNGHGVLFSSKKKPLETKDDLTVKKGSKNTLTNK